MYICFPYSAGICALFRVFPFSFGSHAPLVLAVSAQSRGSHWTETLHENSAATCPWRTRRIERAQESSAERLAGCTRFPIRRIPHIVSIAAYCTTIHRYNHWFSPCIAGIPRRLRVRVACLATHRSIPLVRRCENLPRRRQTRPTVSDVDVLSR